MKSFGRRIFDEYRLVVVPGPEQKYYTIKGYTRPTKTFGCRTAESLSDLEGSPLFSSLDDLKQYLADLYEAANSAPVVERYSIEPWK